ncbi:MAG: hypothetical protein OXT71_10490 [Acidobacteriota bacterium]|nr:hypothetical protein [Acidobacteriota bacterium]
MRKILVPLFAFLFLAASFSSQSPAEGPEKAQLQVRETIRNQNQEAEETVLYFPDYVDGGGWSVQLALSNVDPDAGAEVVVEVYDEEGRPVPDLFESGLTFEIPALGSRVLRSSGAGAIRRGWIQVRARTDSVSGLLTYKEGTTGIEVSVEPAGLDGRFALFVEETDEVGAGVAVFKPEASSSIRLRVRDEEGNDPLDGGIVSHGNFHQSARTLPEWFDAEGIDRGFLKDFRGLLFLSGEDESRFSPLGLRFGKRNQSLSSVPAIRDEVQEPTETTLYFPDYVDGSGWSVQLALSNIATEASASVSVEVFDEEGRPVRDLFDVEPAFLIPSLGSRVLKSAGAGAIRRGWIEVESESAAVSGLLTYRQAGTGVEVSVQPVELGSQFALFVEESPAIGAGVAIFKPDAASTVELRVRDEEGNDPLEGVFINHGNFRQLARTLPEWLGAEGVDTGFLADFRGLLFLRSEDDSPFAPLGLRFGKTSHSLSSVPAVRVMDGDGASGGVAPPPTVKLSVSPGSIDWGESATLTWSSTNAVGAEITPDIGAVPASGSRPVSPRATTTYRITVRDAVGRTQTASVTVGVVVSEQAALTALYEFAGGSGWTDSGNWGTGRPLGEWHGVDVDAGGRVTRLVLRDNGLAGEFPPELGALTHLTTLDLSGNALTGPVPAELGSLVNLTSLALGNNELTGPIPPQLGSLVRLETLELGGNALTGPIPPGLGSLANLELLSLIDNQLSGRIPPGLGSLGNLTSLGLNGNNLTGPIPPELGSLAEATSFSLQSNFLTGPIPVELNSLSSLRTLDLSDNALTGPVPPGMGDLAKLEQLSLQNNFLVGSIPPQLGDLANLNTLRLDRNRLTGSIPPELGSLAELEHLWLSRNQLTDAIPPELGALAKLWNLSLRLNRLTGPVPTELGSAAGLRFLFLDWNRLTGPLPESLLAMDLEEFRIAQNGGLCIPGSPDFTAWSSEIEVLHGRAYCNESDRAVLEAFFEITGGPDWTNSDGWRGEGTLGEWHGVSVDSLGRVTALDLAGNGLEGRVPGNLGSLRQMTELRIGGNALSGRLPLSLSSLTSLQEFHYADTDLCVPAGESFRAWMSGIPSHEGTGTDCPPPSDREILSVLFDATGGPHWTLRDNWMTDRPLKEWRRVGVNDDGRVVTLYLGNNNLTGTIPVELGSLTRLTDLNLGYNALTGPIPPELGSLAELIHLNLDYNRLTGPIPPELGALSNLETLRLFGNMFTGGIPAELGSLANLTDLNLDLTGLTGSIPPELGALTNLRDLWIRGNSLSGPIPPELGALANLENLWLRANGLTGSIPAELGSLASLKTLDLAWNDLTGSIPPELGALGNLEGLWFEGNALSGALPPELGKLTKLEFLRMQDNELTGAVPPEFGGLENVRSIVLSNNGGMTGALPARLTDLGRLEELLANGANLCAPSDAGFRDWLSGVWKRRIGICGAGDPPDVILTQAVQSREFPVPLVAGEEALLRVFVEPDRGTGSDLPPVRATFYRNGTMTHVVDIPGKPVPIPGEFYEGDLNASANVLVPGSVVQPGLEMVIDVDPEGTPGPDAGVTKRIPESGRLAVDVRTMPVFDLTVIPFLWDENPDSSIVELAEGMAGDPGAHPLLKETRALLPIKELDVKAHAPVSTSTNDPVSLFGETAIIHAMEGAGGYYMGTIGGEFTGGLAGLGQRPGLISFSIPHPVIMAHELGHNLSLAHAPCGAPAALDPAFPQMDGSIGDWGYDLIEPGRVFPPVWPDLMAYCRTEAQWIGAYHFTNALRYRLYAAGSAEGSALVAAPAKSLLLWGGVGSDGTPYLEPAFVVDAPARLPRSGGEYEITGRDGDGEELFSLSFAMPELADGDGRSSFAFVLPVRAGWAGELAGITLSGPGGSVRLDEETDRPVSILRDPRTGEIRGIFRGPAPEDGSGDDAVSALAAEPGMEVLTSRGIPAAEDWSR